MNKIKRIRSVLLFVYLFTCSAASNAQHSLYYEFECDYIDNTYIFPIHKHGDSVLIVSDLFEGELAIKDAVVFRFQDSCVFLTIDGQEGLFFGNSQKGSWITKGNEYERFTIRWDSLCCSDNNDPIYKFVFTPYYNEENPYITDDGTMIFHEYNDMTSYYWTNSDGLIAIEGDWLFVRKDQEALKQCLCMAKRCSQR